jgi:DNA-binding CsgD family transcriptional regulator
LALNRDATVDQVAPGEKPVRSRKRWTAEEEQRLANLSKGNLSRGKIAQKLGRSVFSIKAHSAKHETEQKKWTPEEEALLVSLASQPKDVIAEKLGRSKCAIHLHLYRLGLAPKTNPLTAEEKEIVKKLYPFKSTKKIAEMLNCPMSSIQNCANAFGLKKINYFWTSKQDEQLKQLFAQTPTALIARKLGRTVPAVMRRAVTLNLKKENIFWTEEEDALLTKLYPTEKTKEIAKILKRTPEAVIIRAARNNVRKSKSWTVENSAFLIRNYHRMTINEMGAILGKNFGTVWGRIRKLGLKKLNKWSSEEVLLLRTICPTMSISEISSFLNRSKHSVKIKLRRTKNILAPSVQGTVRYRQRWTRQDDEILRQLYHTVPVKDIAGFVGRTENGIQGRARKLNGRRALPKPDDLLNEYSFKFLLRLLAGVDHRAHVKYGHKVHTLLTVLRGERKVRPRREPGALALAFARAYAKIPGFMLEASPRGEA